MTYTFDTTKFSNHIINYLESVVLSNFDQKEYELLKPFTEHVV